MFNALSGSGAATSLIALFAPKRDTSQGQGTTSPAETRSRPPPTTPGGNGMSMQALIAAMMAALNADKDPGSVATTGTDAAPVAPASSGPESPAAMLATLLSSIDSNGDSSLSPAEMQSAVQTLQDLAADPAEDVAPDAATAAPPPASGPVARSFSQSLFEALARSEDQTSAMLTGIRPGERGRYAAQIAA